MQFLAIIFLSVVAAISYGIVHDEITARVCVEYFTIGHPPVFDTDDPTLLGLGWGVIATWWFGLILGMLLALAARAGSRPKWPASRLVRPLTVLLATLAITAAIFGVAGLIAATHGWVHLTGWLAERVPADRHAVFIADLWTHFTSYLGGAIGTVVLCIWTIRGRARDATIRQPADSSHLPRPD